MSRFVRLTLLSLLALLSLLLLCLFAFWLTPSFVAIEGLAAPAAQTMALRNVHIVHPGAADSPAQTILIKAGRIERLQAADHAIDKDYHIIEGNGAFVLPGLIDAHVHLAEEAELTQALSYGVTTVRNMNGRPFHLALRTAQQRGEIAGARLLTSSPSLNSNSPWLRGHVNVDDVQAAQAAVLQMKKAGYDLIKLYDGVSEEIFNAVIKTAEQRAIDVAGHVPYAVPFARVSQHYRSVEHMEELWQNGLDKNPNLIADFAAHLQKNALPLVASVAIVQRLADVCGGEQQAVNAVAPRSINPVLHYLGQQSLMGFASGSEGCDQWRQQVQHMQQHLLTLKQHGVLIALGSDSGPHWMTTGDATWQEMQLLQRLGFSNDDLLQTATLIAAKAIHREHEVGKIAEGFSADLLLLNANPKTDLNTLKDPRSVISQGRFYSTAQLQQLREASQQHRGWWVTLARLFEK